MAESDQESEIKPIPSDTSNLRNLSSTIFGIPGFLVGFGTKGSSESDSIRSPTSPLDIGVFSNFRNPVSLRFIRSSSEKGYRKAWNGNKVGLGIVNSLVDDTKNGVLGLVKQKNIVFGPQVRPNSINSARLYHVSRGSSLRSKSLPTNYVASRLSQSQTNSQQSSNNVVLDNEEVPLESEPLESPSLCFSDSNLPSSLASLTYIHNSRTGKSFSETGPSLESDQASASTVPIPIGPSQGLVGSLSAREIELSEDYTCIISHGPNPKTIHIFGDCVLECHANESSSFGTSMTGSPQVAKNPEESIPVHPHEVLTCHTCKRTMEEDEEVDLFRGEKAFCSCKSEDVSEEETERAYQNSPESSPSSSFHDLFLLGMPVAM